MYRIVVISHYDKDTICETEVEVNAHISRLAHANRTFDIYKVDVLVATGSKSGVKVIKQRNKPVIGKVRYCKG